MPDSLLEPGERAFLEALEELGIPYLIVGVSAAVMQGAPLVTQDIDLWFEDRTDRRLHEAARRAGGVFVPGHFGMMPTQVGGGAMGDRLDVVTTPEGLEAFATEYARARVVDLDGLSVRVLPLARLIESKRAAGRPKDLAVLPALEATLAVEVMRRTDVSSSSAPLRHVLPTAAARRTGDLAATLRHFRHPARH